MAKKYSAFSYKSGSSFLHKCPAWIKLLFIPLVNILFLCLPVYFAVGLILFQFAVACILRFSFGEQAADLKPVIFYAVLLVFMQVLGEVFGGNVEFWKSFTWDAEKESVFMLVKLFCVMQSASLVFKTSTSLELREGIGKIESAIRKFLHLKNKNSFTDTISLFLNFIPMVSKIWKQSKRAWIARGGKTGVKMYLTLLPVLFSVGMKKAYNSARALSIRS